MPSTNDQKLAERIRELSGGKFDYKPTELQKLATRVAKMRKAGSSWPEIREATGSPGSTGRRLLKRFGHDDIIGEANGSKSKPAPKKAPAKPKAKATKKAPAKKRPARKGTTRTSNGPAAPVTSRNDPSIMKGAA